MGPDEPLQVNDGFVNALKGLGAAATDTSTTSFSGGEATIDSYATLYEHNWLARRIVQIFPDDAMRKVPEIEDLDKKEIDRIWAEYDRLNESLTCPQGVLAQGLYQGRALGGAVILLGFKRGAPEDPAPTTGTELYWIDSVAWADLAVQAYETDRNKAGFGKPVLLKIMGEHPRAGEVFHVSRTIPCEGLPRAKYRKSDATPWISVLAPVTDEIQDYGLSWSAITWLLQEASVGVLKMGGLIRMLTSKDETVIKARQKLITEGRSAARTIFLDSEFNEEFSRTEVSFAGVPEILEQMQMRICGAAQIPATRLFGRSPAGQNSTGESDMRNFYDDVSAYRDRAVAPKQTRLLSLIAGKPVVLTYPPLQEMTEKELAEIRRLRIEGDEKQFDIGVVSAEEIRTSRSADGSLGIDLTVGEGYASAATPTA